MTVNYACVCDIFTFEEIKAVSKLRNVRKLSQ